MMIAHHTWRPAEKLVESVYDKNERMCWPRSAGPPVWKRETGRCPPLGVFARCALCVCVTRGACAVRPSWVLCGMPQGSLSTAVPQIYPHNEAWPFGHVVALGDTEKGRSHN